MPEPLPAPRPVAFAVPGELATLTGGTIYDARLIAGLRAAGRTLRHLALPAGFPDPDPGTVRATLDALAALPPDLPAIVDGLAFGALPTDGLARIRAPLVALVHHPLALHYSAGNLSPTVRRRAIAIRYLGDDARWDARPGTFVEKESIRTGLLAPLDFADGARLDGPNFPRC